MQAQGGSATCTHHINTSTGNDTNTGLSPAQAWKTIGRANDTAATSVPTGSVVCIAPGTYYEAIQPRRDGVTYRGLTTGGRFDVVVSGLDPVWIGGPNRPSGEPTWVSQGDGLYKWTWTPRTQPGSNWDLINDAGFPWFASYRISDSGPEHAPRREMLVANTGRPGVGTAADGRLEGHVMLPVGTLADLNSATYRNYANPDYGVYGAFWVETAAPTSSGGVMGRPIAIYARFYGPGGNVAPETAQPRMSARAATFTPRYLDGGPGNVEDCGKADNRGGFTVENIAFRHSNAMIQRGSVCPGRSGSTFRNVAVEFANGAGINTGGHSESTNPTQAMTDETGRDHRFIGVRTNYNGQIGLRGECDRCQVIDSELSYNNWKDHDYGWEAGGSKFSFTSGMLLRRLRVFGNNGPGIWFDAANFDNTVEGSWVDGNALAGIFLELYTARTLVQHNVVSRTRRGRANTYTGFVNNYGGTGFGIQDAPENYLFHNTSVNNDGAGFYFNTTDRVVGTDRGFVYGFSEPAWTGPRARMVNNVAAGNALISSRPPGETASSFSLEAREIQINDPTLTGARNNAFLGNLYLGHGTPAEASLGHHGFGLFPSTGAGGGTANTNPEWKALLGVPLTAPGAIELVLTYGERNFSSLAPPSAWPAWPSTLRMTDAARQGSLPQIPAGSVPNRRQGYCYGWNGANPEAVLGSIFLDRSQPQPTDCPRSDGSTVEYITTNTTLTASSSALYAGKQVYVSDNVTLTISGTFTLRAANGQPARLNLNGRLVGSGTIAVEGGSELVIRPLANTSGFTGSIPLTGTGSCLMVREGARFDLAPGQYIDASDGALVAILTGGTLALGANARFTMRATAAAAQIRPGSRFVMGQNARVEFLNPVQIVGTDAQPVVFESADESAWAGVTVAGAGSRLDHVMLSGGTNNLTVTGSNTVVEHVVSTGAAGSALVIRTPAVRQEPTASPSFAGARETNGVVVRDGRFAGSPIGVQVHLASGIAMSRNAVEGNGFGATLFNATVSTFRQNVITANEKYGLYLSGTSSLGVGPAEAASSAVPGGCSAGLNRITGSGSAEIMAESGSSFGLGQNGFAGTFDGFNEISDASGVLVWTGDKRGSSADFTWWGGPLDPERIVGAVSTDYALSSNPTTGSGTASGCATASEILADARTRLDAVPVTADHEAAVRDLLVPALDADPSVRSAALVLLAT